MIDLKEFEAKLIQDGYVRNRVDANRWEKMAPVVSLGDGREYATADVAVRVDGNAEYYRSRENSLYKNVGNILVPLMGRDLSPFPFTDQTYGLITLFHSRVDSKELIHGSCNFKLAPKGNYLRPMSWRDRSHIVMAVNGVYTAGWAYDGSLAELTLNYEDTEKTPAVRFDFWNRLIKIGVNASTPLARCLNAGTPVLSNERHFRISQSDLATTGTVVRPFGDKPELVKVTVPTNLPVEDLIKMLSRDNRDWTEVRNHIKVDLSLPKGPPVMDLYYKTKNNS